MKKTFLLSLFAVFAIGVMAQTKVTMVADASGSGRYFAKLYPTSTVGINKEDATAFSFYLSKGVAFFTKLKIQDGMFIVKPGDHVVLFTLEPKEVNLVLEDVSGYESSVWVIKRTGKRKDDVFTLDADQSLADFRKAKGLTEDQYVYRMTNNASSGGFGFTYFTGTTMRAGQFFIITDLKPSSKGRLAVQWLDEDGNEIPEFQTTGIQDVKSSSADDNAVYTLQGVRVTAPQKGQLYIRNGRKFVNN